jgi:hypothetical protein
MRLPTLPRHLGRLCLPASDASPLQISACGATLSCLICAATIWAGKGLELPIVEDRQQQQLTVTVRTVFMITGTRSQSDSWAWTLADDPICFGATGGRLGLSTNPFVSTSISAAG